MVNDDSAFYFANDKVVPKAGKKKKKLTESFPAGSEFSLIDGGKHFGKNISQLHLDKKLFN